EKLAAVAVVRERSDQDARALLGGLPSGIEPNVQKAAASAIAAIDAQLARWRMVQNLWYGISLGSVLLLAAIGLAITFGVMGVIQFLYGRPLETLLATWGISLILQQAVRTAFGPSNREVGTPSFMSGVVE